MTGHAGGRGRKTSNAKSREWWSRRGWSFADRHYGGGEDGPLCIDGHEYSRRLRARRKRRR